MQHNKINLLGLSHHELVTWCQEHGHQAFRARQLLHWIHQEGITDFAAMTDLAKNFRSWLSNHACIDFPTIIRDHTSADGTRKWLLDVGQSNAIETVFIPEKTRGTLCVSSQAGCNVGCTFCSTGAQGFSRNLSTSEIMGQLWMAEFLMRQPECQMRLTTPSDHATSQNESSLSASSKRAVSNVVFMGMGEPLLNFDAVVKAISLMLEDHAYGLSKRRVTVSTSGVVPKIRELARTLPIALAVSLHAPNDELRDQLVPLNQKYPLAKLIDACVDYLDFAPRDFITFEYCMLDGINDRPEHAQQLLSRLKPVSCKLNLIPFNPFPQSGYRASTPESVKQFAHQLTQGGIVTTIRKTRGQDIDAACGQLAGSVDNILRQSPKSPRLAIMESV